MKSKTFTGIDAIDVEQQLWTWQTSGRPVIVKHRHPIEHLSIVHRAPAAGKKLLPANSVSMRLDYEEVSSV
jgi:hypothetical protein